jgi:glycosyltransferase involved in cell wall biosynthesis
LSKVAYAVITPARDEAANLPRLAASLAAQTVPPRLWIVVDNGSTDGTYALAVELAATHQWMRVRSVPGAQSAERGAPIVRALMAGLAELEREPPDIVVNVDADVSFEADYFEQLLAEFNADPNLGIASGGALELERGEWRRRHVTGTTVWGASRAFRWECLQNVLPLEERVAWDGVDEFKANARGWRTQTFPHLSFSHHRREGARDGSWRSRVNQGAAAYYLGYRPWYLLLRALWNSRHEPSAVAMAWGYAGASLRRAPRLDDEAARRYLRSQQSARKLPLRFAEAFGRNVGRALSNR